MELFFKAFSVIFHTLIDSLILDYLKSSIEIFYYIFSTIGILATGIAAIIGLNFYQNRISQIERDRLSKIRKKYPSKNIGQTFVLIRKETAKAVYLLDEKDIKHWIQSPFNLNFLGYDRTMVTMYKPENYDIFNSYETGDPF